MKTKKYKAMTPDDFDDLCVEISKQSRAVEHLVTKDKGPSIMGEGIDAVVIPRSCSKVRVIQVFTNPWTQGEQPKAIQELMLRVLAKAPHLREYVTYNPGRMD